MCFHQPVTFSEAEQEYNSSKNRFSDKLPSEFDQKLASHIHCTTRMQQSLSNLLDTEWHFQFTEC